MYQWIAPARAGARRAVPHYMGQVSLMNWPLNACDVAHSLHRIGLRSIHDLQALQIFTESLMLVLIVVQAEVQTLAHACWPVDNAMPQGVSWETKHVTILKFQ